jgi:hypothetical protein
MIKPKNVNYITVTSAYYKIDKIRLLKKMRKIFLYCIIPVLTAFLLASCEKEEIFDESFLPGKWESGTMYYRYFSNGDGYSWDEGDDVTEEEAQGFTWTLEHSVLTHIHILEIGGTVPRVYTVTELTPSSLKYEDDFGRSYSFTKVNE